MTFALENRIRMKQLLFKPSEILLTVQMNLPLKGEEAKTRPHETLTYANFKVH